LRLDVSRLYGYDLPPNYQVISTEERHDAERGERFMNARQATVVAVFAGLLMGCAATQEPAGSQSPQNSELSALRQQFEVLRSQMELERGNVNSLKTQITSLEGRLRAMQDMLMAKDEDIARLETEVEKLKTKKRPARTF
jgi:septal ring factor EnvC (AmiA/AmiB activator)